MKYFKIIIAVLCCTFFSCVEDHEFAGDGLFSEANIKVISANDHIELICDLDKHAIAGKVTEKGFYFSRKDNNKKNSYTDKITLAPTDEFKCTISNDLRKGLECSVVAYVKEYSHEFTSNEELFTCQSVSAAPEVSDVLYEYDDESKITGKITITGKNFGTFKQLYLTSGIKDLKGELDFVLEECNESMAKFKYKCCNVGDIPLSLNTFTANIKLPKDLIIDGPKLNIGSTSVIMGIPQTFSITIGNKKIDKAICKINGKKLDVANNYFKNKELAYIPVGDFGTHSLDFGFVFNADTVYFLPNEVKFVNGWKKIGKIEEYMRIPQYAYDRIWFTDTENRTINSVSLKDFSLKKYTPKNYDDTFMWNTSMGPLIIKEDGIYFSEDCEPEPQKMRIRRYNPKTDKFEIYKDVPIDPLGDWNAYEDVHLFEIIGNEFYIRYDRTGDIIAWNKVTNKMQTKGNIGEEWLYYNYLGTDGKAFYTEDSEGSTLYRYPINNISRNVMDPSLNSQITGNGLFVDPRSHIVYNGRFYQSGLMRSTNLSDMTDHIYYGLPRLGARFVFIPSDKAIYCLDYSRNDIYQYIGK